MEYSVNELIKKRRSVRTYDQKAITAEDMAKLTDYLNTLTNPWNIPVEFRFLSAKQHGLSSPVIVGTDQFFAAKVAKVPQFEIAYGYTFEKFCLYALSLGLGTVMLGGTFNRQAFERAMELTDNQIMPLASPLGYIARKMSMRESVMRKAVGADKRLPFEEVFLDCSLDKGLTANAAGIYAEALEMVRLAPSAVNKQPWRVVVCGNTVHFYKKPNKSLSGHAYDIQMVDIGIALCHFHLTLLQQGINGNFVVNNPSLATDDKLEYVISFVTVND